MEFEKREEEFKWTDMDVFDFAIFYQNESGKPSPRSLIERFKKSQTSADKKYPEGIMQFENSLPFMDWWNTMDYVGHREHGYQKYVKEHLDVGRKISKVRNSLGEVLEVGMETNEGKIESFSISGQMLAGEKVVDGFFCRTKTSLGSTNINIVHPKKEKKYMSVDGFEIKDGECYTIVSKDDFHTSVDKWKSWLIFNDKSNAEKFVEENKPRFSKKQIEDVGILIKSELVAHHSITGANAFAKILKEKLDL